MNIFFGILNHRRYPQIFVFLIVVSSLLFFLLYRSQFNFFYFLGDWPIAIQRYEAVSKLLLTYDSYIYWLNIWVSYSPLLHRPYGLQGIFSILFNSNNAIYFLIFTYFLIGFIGIYKISIKYNIPTLHSIYLIIYFLLNPSLYSHISAGHIGFINALSLPLLLWLTTKFHINLFYSLIFLIIFVLNFYDSFNYTFQYNFIILLIFWIYNFFRFKDWKYKCIYLKNTLLICIVFLFYCYSDIHFIYETLLDTPREVAKGTVFYSISDFISNVIGFPILNNDILKSEWCRSKHEINGFIGIFSLPILIYLFRKNIYLISFIIFLVILPYLSDSNIYSPMYWIRSLPTFSSHLCYSRIRITTYIILILTIITFYKDIDKKDFDNKILIFLLLFNILEITYRAYDPLINMSVRKFENCNKSSEFQNSLSLRYNVSGTLDVASATRCNLLSITGQDSYISINNNFINLVKFDQFYKLFSDNDLNYITNYSTGFGYISFCINVGHLFNTNIPYNRNWYIDNKNRTYPNALGYLSFFISEPGCYTLEYYKENKYIVLFKFYLLIFSILFILIFYISKVQKVIPPSKQRTDK